MKKITQITTLLFIVIIANFHLSISAQEPTPTAKASPTPSTETKDSQDIEKIRQAVKDKVKEKIDQIINKTSQKTGWVGQITQINDNHISLNCFNQDTRLVLIDPDTTIVNSKRQQVEPEQLKTDQIILAMGYLDADGHLQTKRILITNKPIESLKNTILLATITDISQTASIMTLVTNDRQAYQIKTGQITKDITKNQKIIVVLKQEEGESNNNWQIVDFKTLSTTPSPTPTPTESE